VCTTDRLKFLQTRGELHDFVVPGFLSKCLLDHLFQPFSPCDSDFQFLTGIVVGF